MKIKKAFALVALPALGLALTSCGPKVENYGEDIADLYNDAAEELLDCETSTDIDDAVEEIEALTKDAEELVDDIDKDINKMRDEVYSDLTNEERTDIEYVYSVEVGKAKNKLKDGMYHVKRNLKGDAKDLDKALDKFRETMHKAEQKLREGKEIKD